MTHRDDRARANNELLLGFARLRCGGGNLDAALAAAESALELLTHLEPPHGQSRLQAHHMLARIQRDRYSASAGDPAGREALRHLETWLALTPANDPRVDDAINTVLALAHLTLEQGLAANLWITLEIDSGPGGLQFFLTQDEALRASVLAKE